MIAYLIREIASYLQQHIKITVQRFRWFIHSHLYTNYTKEPPGLVTERENEWALRDYPQFVSDARKPQPIIKVSKESAGTKTIKDPYKQKSQRRLFYYIKPQLPINMM
eukprot:517426_1